MTYSLLTTAQAADRLHVTRHLMEMWRMRHTGPEYTRIDGKVHYTQEALEQWVMQSNPSLPRPHESEMARQYREARERVQRRLIKSKLERMKREEP